MYPYKGRMRGNMDYGPNEGIIRRKMDKFVELYKRWHEGLIWVCSTM